MDVDVDKLVEAHGLAMALRIYHAMMPGGLAKDLLREWVLERQPLREVCKRHHMRATRVREILRAELKDWGDVS